MDAHETEQSLIQQAKDGDDSALGQLFALYRARLAHSVRVRMDRRLQARVDPSDVVQDALIDAARKFEVYAETCPVPFFAWLREIAANRLTDLHRRHLLADKRSVRHEEAKRPPLPDESFLDLAERLLANSASPSGKMLQKEQLEGVQNALERLPEIDREILVLRYLEKLSTREIAAVVELSEGNVKVRHFRALQRIRTLLIDAPPEKQP